ncbi:hypothetical protein [Butyrivibrio sp. AE3004]|uniref:hypothetical protein n=1 Tax=Butyrivibrio sp. AE3004 TaxID=1506994 RepID=UPI0004949B08|nr:hypothetical protein [Butyrivibrio sp. AE3004]
MSGQGMGNNKYSGMMKISGVILVTACLLKAVVLLFKDTIIVYSGIRMYGVLNSITGIILLVSGVVFAAILIILASSYAKGRKEEIIREVQNDKGPDLKMKGELDPVRIRENLKEKSSDWNGDAHISEALNAIYVNMDDMDGYQAKLKELLDSNGADALRDTEEVLDKVEQHICRNVRKLINIMIVLDSRSENDKSLMLATTKKCTEDNKKLLDTTRNFMMAVSQFLNSQGEDGGTIEEVESYKKILTDQIQEGGIYR